MIINIYYNGVAYYKSLSGGPSKAWFIFRQIHWFGLSASSELQSDYPW
jgi:hypothetical protein